MVLLGEDVVLQAQARITTTTAARAPRRHRPRAAARARNVCPRALPLRAVRARAGAQGRGRGRGGARCKEASSGGRRWPQRPSPPAWSPLPPFSQNVCHLNVDAPRAGSRRSRAPLHRSPPPAACLTVPASSRSATRRSQPSPPSPWCTNTTYMYLESCCPPSSSTSTGTPTCLSCTAGAGAMAGVRAGGLG